MAKVQGQIANEPLVSAEQFSAGGLSSVRGYLEGEVPGDNAIIGSIELRSPSLIRCWERTPGMARLYFLRRRLRHDQRSPAGTGRPLADGQCRRRQPDPSLRPFQWLPRRRPAAHQPIPHRRPRLVVHLPGPGPTSNHLHDSPPCVSPSPQRRPVPLKLLFLGLLGLFSISASAHAWWNPEWTIRKKITVDTALAGLNPGDAPDDCRGAG
ncbi:MAG: ShlB/FhaC/HecB family hemolysin secretion/activation protein [Chthoniobacter sp.]